MHSFRTPYRPSTPGTNHPLPSSRHTLFSRFIFFPPALRRPALLNPPASTPLTTSPSSALRIRRHPRHPCCRFNYPTPTKDTSTMAFIARPPLPTPRASPSALRPGATGVTCRSEVSHATPAYAVSRRIFLTSSAAALVAMFGNGAPAFAKNGTGLERAFSSVFFPKEGFNAPDDAPPSSATVDQSVLNSKMAQEALQTIKGYDKAIADMYDKFKADPQIEVAAPVRKLVSISDLRNALNIVNEAIDEESQIRSDKVVRGIIQDIGELETAAYVKKGASRTRKKIERTTDWFVKLQGDFTRLLAFYS